MFNLLYFNEDQNLNPPQPPNENAQIEETFLGTHTHS
jgi:hypothetical protein